MLFPDSGRLMKRAVFLARDGVISHNAAEGEYVTRWEDFHFLAGAVEAISSLDRAGWGAIVISNQRCVAKVLLTIGLRPFRQTGSLYQSA